MLHLRHPMVDFEATWTISTWSWVDHLNIHTSMVWIFFRFPCSLFRFQYVFQYYVCTFIGRLEYKVMCSFLSKYKTPCKKIATKIFGAQTFPSFADFYLLCGCNTANFESLSCGQLNSPDVNHFFSHFLTQRSPGASLWDWLPRASRLPSEVWTGKLPIRPRHLKTLGHSPQV